MPVEDDATIKKILLESKTVAVVGASTKPWRDSNSIASFLIQNGYKVFPVNPKYKEVLGLRCYADLISIPEPVDIVDVFRDPEAVDEIVGQAIRAKARVFWMQLGVVNERAARRAEQAGIRVVMDHCIAVEHRRLLP